MYTVLDTIAAIATPPGEGALGIIRLSGPDAIALADVIFKGKKLANQPSHTLHFGRIADGDRNIDEVVISLFKAPRSYTGEDLVEISAHGSSFILEQILALCTREGARMARPGEFTQRAFLNGKLDLTQAEAVADLIASRSAAAHKSALHNLRGGFSQRLKELREQLVQFAALIELELDFSQEDVEFADRSQLYLLLDTSIAEVAQLEQSFSLGNAIRQGVKVAIIGKPNAGKSTLLNALLNEERAIVSDIAGTTRDTIEETLNIDGVLFRLIDTAGIREHTHDTIERIGIERSRKAITEADVVVQLFDLTDVTTAEIGATRASLEAAGKKYLLAGNKLDLLPEARTKDNDLFPEDMLLLSAKGEGASSVREALYKLAVSGQVAPEDTVITNARHHAALEQVLQSLHDIRNGMDNNQPGDLLALDIRRCLHFIGEITGEVTTEDKLDYIFSKFCIGK